MRGLPVKQKDGSIILYAIGIEITKRKTAELELAEINSNLEVLVEQRAEKAIKLAQELELYWLAAKHSKTGVWRYELATNSLHWDDTMYEIFGIAKEEFSGAYEAWETSLHPSDKEAAVAALNKSIETGEDLNILFRIIVKPSGEIRYVQGMGKIEQDEQGNTISAYGVNWYKTRDIEQAQKREEVIRDLEVYKAAAKNAEVGVWSHNMETEHGFWDKGLMDIYELDVDNYPNGVPHSEWLEMIHPSDRARVKQYVSDARSSKTQMDMTFKIITAKTQTLKHIRGTGTFSIDKNGKVDSIYGTNWDITRDVKLSEERALALEELKEAQSFLVQSEKMASLGILTAGVAQELNNPLNCITGGL